MYQCVNGAIPSRKCSIKAPAKWRNSVYVLMEICHHKSKWLDSNKKYQIHTYLHIMIYIFLFCREEYPLGTWRVYYRRTRHPRVRVVPVPGQSPARWHTHYPITRVLMEPNIRHIIHICCLHKVQKVRPQQLTNGIHQIWRQPRALHRLRYYTTTLRIFCVKSISRN